MKDFMTLAIWFFGIFAVLGLIVLLLNNIFSVLTIVAIGCGLGYAADKLYPSRSEHGWIGAAAMGLTGALVGNYLVAPLFSTLLAFTGPTIKGVYLIPSFLGALLVAWGLRTKNSLDRVKALEAYKARSDGSDPMLLAQLQELRIIRFLGAGGYSRVYGAVPESTLRESEQVAVKVFTESALEAEGFVERLEREVKLCQCLEHPNIVKVHSAGNNDQIHYLVMEFVRGDTLAQRLKKGTMALDEAVDILVDLASAMAHAHAKGIIHRDIKPENVVLSPQGPKIMDFGLARLEGTSSLTQSGSAIGTPHYMSPEQVLGEKTLDGRCDQYSLGGVAFEMITGSKLFEGDQAVLVLMKHVDEPPRNPCDVRPEIPQPLARIVLRMLEKKPEDRYPSMDEVVQELLKLGKVQPVVAKKAK